MWAAAHDFHPTSPPSLVIWLHKRVLIVKAGVVQIIFNDNDLFSNHIISYVVLYFFLSGREYSIPSPLQRLLAEMVDFFILFFIKATIIISIMHLSGIKWVCLLYIKVFFIPLQKQKQILIWVTVWVSAVYSFAFQGCLQVCHAFYCGRNRWGHIDGGATENDACRTCLPHISVFLWGEHSYWIGQIVIQVRWD